MPVLASPEYVSAGSRMTWTGQFNSGSVTNWSTAFKEALLFSSPYDAVAAVSAALKNQYNLIVERADNGTNWSGGSGAITLYLRTDEDRGDGETDDGLTDIGGNVADSFQAQGFPVSSWAIDNYVRVPSSGSTVAPPPIRTGAPQPTVQEQQQAEQKAAGSSWWEQFTGKLEAGSIGLLIGGAVVVVLVIVVIAKSEAPV